MGNFSNLREFYATGSRRPHLIVAGTMVLNAVLFGLLIWLSAETGWPDAYGFRCHGRACIMAYLSHSPQLLWGGSIYEIGLFTLLWLLPTFMVGAGIYALVRRLAET